MKETIYQRFLFAIFRHLISSLAGMLVTWGWIDAELANQFTESVAFKLATGAVALVIALYLSYKDKIWEFLKTKVAIAMPPNSTVNEVAQVASTVENKTAVAKGDEPVGTN